MNEVRKVLKCGKWLSDQQGMGDMGKTFGDRYELNMPPEFYIE
jgi:hypothetical protein